MIVIVIISMQYYCYYYYYYYYYSLPSAWVLHVRPPAGMGATYDLNIYFKDSIPSYLKRARCIA